MTRHYRLPPLGGRTELGDRDRPRHDWSAGVGTIHDWRPHWDWRGFKMISKFADQLCCVKCWVKDETSQNALLMSFMDSCIDGRPIHLPTYLPNTKVLFEDWSDDSRANWLMGTWNTLSDTTILTLLSVSPMLVHSLLRCGDVAPIPCAFDMKYYFKPQK